MANFVCSIQFSKLILVPKAFAQKVANEKAKSGKVWKKDEK